MPRRQPKRGRLWLNDGACVRLRPERPDHVWAYDFVEDRTRDGRKFRLLCVVDEFTREALAIRVARKLGAAEVIDVLADLFLARGVPAHIRSDQGPGFVAEAVKGWIAGVGAATARHREGESVGERLRGELQRQAPRRAAGLRGVQHAPRGAGTDRAVAPALQRRAAAQRARLPPARAGGRHRRPAAAPPLRPDRVSTAAHSHAPLKFRPDHSMGAGHPGMGVEAEDADTRTRNTEDKERPVGC